MPTLDFKGKSIIHSHHLSVPLRPLQVQAGKYGFRGMLCLAVLYIAVMTGWISDDAQITFRQIWNFINGDGMTFNYGERVQAFTHPLWFFLLSGVTAITWEPFSTTIAVSICLSFLAVILLLAVEWKANHGRITLFTPVVLLIFSVAFCDYMTSGLENPLSYFLIGLLLWSVVSGSRCCWVFLLLSMLVLTRFDYGLLFLPFAALLAITSFQTGGIKRLLRDIWPGAVLLLLWLIFALFYFGSPLPNTYYAKMTAGYPTAEVFERGVNYFSATLRGDPISMVIIFAGIVLSFASRNRIVLALAAGQILYLGFIFNAGGDFMRGRFFAVPVFLSVGQLVLAYSDYSSSFAEIRETEGRAVRPLEKPRYRYAPWMLLSVAVLLGAITQYPFLSTPDYNSQGWVDGIADERGALYQGYGLMARNRRAWPSITDQSDYPPRTWTYWYGGLGRASLMNIRNVHLVDLYALTDPFLARLPAARWGGWRIGHHGRKLPTDYGEFLLGNVESIPDTDLNPLLQDVALVARGDLFTTERLKAILRLNTGYHSGVDMEEYRDISFRTPILSEQERITIAELDNSPKSNGFVTDVPGVVRVFHDFGLHIQVDGTVETTQIQLSLSHDDDYNIRVNGELVAAIAKHEAAGLRGLLNHTVDLPKPTVVKDIEITGAGDHRYIIGHLHVR